MARPSPASRPRLGTYTAARWRYQPIDSAEVAGGALEGYSAALNVVWRWEDSRLGCHDPAIGLHIATFESERVRADTAEARADTAEAGRNAAETRVRELEAELRRWQGG